MVNQYQWSKFSVKPCSCLVCRAGCWIVKCISHSTEYLHIQHFQLLWNRIISIETSYLHMNGNESPVAGIKENIFNRDRIYHLHIFCFSKTMVNRVKSICLLTVIQSNLNMKVQKMSRWNNELLLVYRSIPIYSCVFESNYMSLNIFLYYNFVIFVLY